LYSSQKVDALLIRRLLYCHGYQIGNRALSANKLKDAPNEKAGLVPAFAFAAQHLQAQHHK
jgi:hypothetical protein